MSLFVENAFVYACWRPLKICGLSLSTSPIVTQKPSGNGKICGDERATTAGNVSDLLHLFGPI